MFVGSSFKFLLFGGKLWVIFSAKWNWNWSIVGWCIIRHWNQLELACFSVIWQTEQQLCSLDEVSLRSVMDRSSDKQHELNGKPEKVMLWNRVVRRLVCSSAPSWCENSKRGRTGRREQHNFMITAYQPFERAKWIHRWGYRYPLFSKG